MSYPILPITETEAAELIRSSAPGRAVTMPYGWTGGSGIYLAPTNRWAFARLAELRDQDVDEVLAAVDRTVNPEPETTTP